MAGIGRACCSRPGAIVEAPMRVMPRSQTFLMRHGACVARWLSDLSDLERESLRGSRTMNIAAARL
jgi:hypothetical protein